MKAMAIALLLLVLPTVLSAAPKRLPPYQLAPYKDELFQYQNILDRQYDGDYLLVEYNRPRDLHARDAVVGTKVNPQYVSLETAAVQSELQLKVGSTSVKYVGVGMTAGGAKAIVIFVHGLGASHLSGVNDWIHGGNFNRIKNLMMRNGGAYLSTSISDFGRLGAAQVKALLIYEAGLSPGAPIFLACSSLGGHICWQLVHDPGVGPLLGGLVLVDVPIDTQELKTAAALAPTARVPIQISSSREDTIIGWKSQLQFFKTMKSTIPDYPIRYVLFSAGTHGLSLRMTDWRMTLNWMLVIDDQRKASSK
jgi:pimeloyl-ACP methyl ester carboxylesterase